MRAYEPCLCEHPLAIWDFCRFVRKRTRRQPTFARDVVHLFGKPKRRVVDARHSAHKARERERRKGVSGVGGVVHDQYRVVGKRTTAKVERAKLGEPSAGRLFRASGCELELSLSLFFFFFFSFFLSLFLCFSVSLFLLSLSLSLSLSLCFSFSLSFSLPLSLPPSLVCYSHSTLTAGPQAPSIEHCIRMSSGRTLTLCRVCSSLLAEQVVSWSSSEEPELQAPSASPLISSKIPACDALMYDRCWSKTQPKARSKTPGAAALRAPLIASCSHCGREERGIWSTSER